MRGEGRARERATRIGETTINTQRDDDAMYYTTNQEINVYQGERV